MASGQQGRPKRSRRVTQGRMNWATSPFDHAAQRAFDQNRYEPPLKTWNVVVTQTAGGRAAPGAMAPSTITKTTSHSPSPALETHESQPALGTPSGNGIEN